MTIHCSWFTTQKMSSLQATKPVWFLLNSGSQMWIALKYIVRWIKNRGFSMRVAPEHIIRWNKEWGFFLWCSIVSSQAILYHFCFLSESGFHIFQTSKNFIRSWPICSIVFLSKSIGISSSSGRNFSSKGDCVALETEILPSLQVKGSSFCMVRETCIGLQNFWEFSYKKTLF